MNKPKHVLGRKCKGLVNEVNFNGFPKVRLLPWSPPLTVSGDSTLWDETYVLLLNEVKRGHGD